MRPVLLVHGLLATPGLMRPLRRRLRSYGHDVHLAPDLGRLVTGDVGVHARELDHAVERVRRHTGAERVDVVGASQGGIVALQWAADGGWDRLGRLIALGTPFLGSPVARLVAPLGLVMPGIAQLRAGSERLAGLAGAALERPVTSIALRGDPVCPPSACALPGAHNVVVDLSWGPLTHQFMMMSPVVARAVHEALGEPC